MRGIPFIALLIFSFVLIFIEWLAFIGFKRSLPITSKKVKNVFYLIYWLIAILLLSMLLTTFGSSSKIRQTTDYWLFGVVVMLTMFNIIPKMIIGISTIIAFLTGFFNRKMVKLISTAGVILGSGMLVVLLYGAFVGKNQLQVEKITIQIPTLPNELNGLTIVQISDVHLGNYYGSTVVIEKVAKSIQEIKPDLLLFTGDMVNNFSFESKGYEGYFQQMQAKYGKYAITGNHDYGDYYHWPSPEARDNNLQEIRELIKRMGFDLLLNENRKIAIQDTSMYMIGVENWGHDPFPKYAELEKATINIPEKAFSILMSHDPAHWDAQVVSKTRIPLTLSGHTHGLQFGFKLAGIELSPMYFIQKYWAGIYQQNDQYLYVNRGLGFIGFNARIEMKPELTIITLTN